MKTAIIVSLIALAFGVARFVVPVEGTIVRQDIFKDLAHVFVGFAFGWAFYTPEQFRLWGFGGVNWIIPAILTLVEVIAFVVRQPH